MTKIYNFLFVSLFISLFASCAGQNKHLQFDAELTQFKYPFPVKEYQFESQNQKMVMAYGDLNSSSKKVAVLLHGKNFSGYYWDQIAQDLVQKGYRVIIPDQIGFGKSTKPRSYQYSMQQLALNTSELIKSLNIEKYHLVGHSMGGMVATHMASMTNSISKLTLINPIGLENYLRYVEFKDVDTFYKNEKKKSVEAFRNYQKKNYYDGKWADRYEALLTPFKGWRAGEDWELVAWNNALTYQPIFANEIVSLFPYLKVPVTLVLGTRDRTGPGRGWKKPGVTKKLGLYQNLGREIKKLNPKFVTVINLKGLGHMPHFEDYYRFSKVFYPLF